jgi:hypothetical protein
VLSPPFSAQPDSSRAAAAPRPSNAVRFMGFLLFVSL